MQVLSEIAVEERPCDGSGPKDHDFSWVGILCGEAEGCTVSVMDFVDVSIEWTVVECLVRCNTVRRRHARGHSEDHTKVMEHVFEDKEEEYLDSHRLPRRERHLIGSHAEGFSNWVEQPNLFVGHQYGSSWSSQKIKSTYNWKFDSEMRQKNIFGAFPLLCWRRNFLGL